MTASGTRENRNLRQTYRATFQEYAAKLNTLQGLIDRGATGTDEFQAALEAVETARAAHSHARDCLAKELMRRTTSVATGPEQQIRKTARLIWEFAGRPEGTAERDWQRAEKLVRAAAVCW
jgi:multidrug resistance efflux pump